MELDAWMDKVREYEERTFADYIDPNLHGVSDPKMILNSKVLRDFLDEHGLTGLVKYIGTGEKSTDLRRFDAKEYVDSIFAD